MYHEILYPRTEKLPGQRSFYEEMVQKSKSQVLQRLGKVIMVMELYRDTKTGKEVLVRIAYDTNKSKKEAIEAIRSQLDLSPEWGKKLGNILGVQEI